MSKTGPKIPNFSDLLSRLGERLRTLRDQIPQKKISPWGYGAIAGVAVLGILGVQVWDDWWVLQNHPSEDAQKKFNASLELVKTIATIGGGVFVLWNIRLTQTRLITERFSKAVEQLGSDKIEVRLGGIYALERIAVDSDRDHWTIMEVLTSFIKERSPNQPIPEEQIRAQAYEMWQKNNGNRTDEERWLAAERELAAERITKDIQAALTVIGRRQEKDPHGRHLDLSVTNLSSADLREANLQKAVLTAANLQGAVLWRAKLQGARLWRANLQKADLVEANLQKADLIEANLQKADLRWAKLQGAWLSVADLQGADLLDTNLQKAVLAAAKLQGGNLMDADLQEADLGGAKLQGAILWRVDLRQTQGLTQEQLEGKDPPLLCHVALPNGLNINPDRDCDRIPQVLHERYPERYLTFDDVKKMGWRYKWN